MNDQDSSNPVPSASNWRHSDMWLWLRIFRCFRMAIAPNKLLLALSLVVLLFIGGMIMDAIAGQRVVENEFIYYVGAQNTQQYEQRLENAEQRNKQAAEQLLTQMPGPSEPVVDREQWLQIAERFDWWIAARQVADEHFKQQRDDLIAQAGEIDDQRLQRQLGALKQREENVLNQMDQLRPKRSGIFVTALRNKVGGFHSMVRTVLQGNIGISSLRGYYVEHGMVRGRTTLDSIRLIGVYLPGWLLKSHPWFLLVWSLFALLVWSLLGGALARSAVVEAAHGKRISMSEAVRFAYSRWLQFIAAPMTAPLLLFGLGVVLLLGGLVFFNFPILDILGALLLPIALVIGFIMALVFIGYLFAVHLMYPALAGENSDFMDAVSRSYGYFRDRPWHMLGLSFVGLVYGAATHIFVGIVAYLTLLITHLAVGFGVFHERFDQAIFTRPEFGQIIYRPDADMAWHTAPAAWLAAVFIHIVVGLVGAYALSFYFCVYSQIYLILRRWVDGTPIHELADSAQATQALSDESQQSTTTQEESGP